VKRGDQVALKLGGRAQWRIERSNLEDVIQCPCDETARGLKARRDRADD
jgi:hypothetical protein